MPFKRRDYEQTPDPLRSRKAHTLIAGLDGTALPTDTVKRGGCSVTVTRVAIDEAKDDDSEMSRLVELRGRFVLFLRDLRETRQLTPHQVETVRKTVSRPRLGVRALADEEGRSPASVSSELKTITRRLPAFANVRHLKRCFVPKRGPLKCSKR